MSFTYVEFGKLNISIQKSIVSLYKSYNTERHFLEACLDNYRLYVPTHRLRQTDFLKEVAVVLNNEQSPFFEKRTIILNAAVYLIWKRISDSYYMRSPESSVLYNSLLNALGIDKDNTPTEINIKNMYTELYDFLRMQVYVEGKAENGIFDPSVQTFKAVHIDTIRKYLDYLIDEIARLEKNIRTAANKEIENPKSSSYMNFLFQQRVTLLPKNEENNGLKPVK